MTDSWRAKVGPKPGQSLRMDPPLDSKGRRLNSPSAISKQWPNLLADGRVSPTLTVLARNTIGAELLVTNLDANIDPATLRRTLMGFFRQIQVPVLQMSLLTSQHFMTSSTHQDTNEAASSPSAAIAPAPASTHHTKAVVKVASPRDAQLAIKEIHRKKVGSKRVVISMSTGDRSPPLNVLRAEVVSVLEEIPSKRLAVVTFQEVFFSRYHRPISMSEINKLKGVIQWVQPYDGFGYCNSFGGNGRYIELSKASRSTPSKDLLVESSLPFCGKHCKQRESWSSCGWAERETPVALPSIRISLKELAVAVHCLLDNHGGVFPLNTVADCYEAVIGRPLDENGKPSVPLEHLISCLPGVQITPASGNGFKLVQWMEKETEQETENEKGGEKRLGLLATTDEFPLREENGSREAMAKQLQTFGREVRDLLKNQPLAQIPFAKFVPAYHGHFGRQCCVHQYGYTKLIDLLDALPQVVQVLGKQRTLTLTHREQTKRFAADLLRVLKSQTRKKVKLSDFPAAYERVMMKAFDVTDYGVCSVEDILSEVWEGTVLMSTDPETNDQIIEIPKREQTRAEKKRTKAFAKEVVELLGSTPSLSMSFSKFIPSYHHFFNRQCKVSDFGFVKLIELLEELSPEVVEIERESGEEEKLIRLSREKRLKVINQRIRDIVRANINRQVAFDYLCQCYRIHFGHTINFEDYGANDLAEFLLLFPDSLRIVAVKGRKMVSIAQNISLTSEVPFPPIKWLRNELLPKSPTLSVSDTQSSNGDSNEGGNGYIDKTRLAVKSHVSRRMAANFEDSGEDDD